MSPAAKLCGFVLLLALIFAGPYAAGARVGPVAPGHSPAPSAPAQPGMGGMTMGGGG